MEAREIIEKSGFAGWEECCVWLKARQKGAPHRDSDCAAMRQRLQLITTWFARKRDRLIWSATKRGGKNLKEND
jgi:hypothetical protein